MAKGPTPKADAMREARERRWAEMQEAKKVEKKSAPKPKKS